MQFALSNTSKTSILGSTYRTFGMQLPERNESVGDSYRYGFQNQEVDSEIKGEGNSVNYEYRMHDPRLGRFFAVDPLESKYPWNSVYAFSANRVIDGIELEGLEVENAMTTFSKPGELKVKLPKNGETQYYSVLITNSNKTFEQFKKDFKKQPEYYLTNDKAKFNAPVDGQGNKTTFKKGAYIKIDIDGPMNNCYIKINSIKELGNGTLTAQFYTMEGHIENGIINFTISKQGDDILFEISSNSEVDYGALKVKVADLDFEEFARDQQASSWNNMLKKLPGKLGGKQKGEVKSSSVTPEQSKKVDKMKKESESEQMEWQTPPGN